MQYLINPELGNYGPYVFNKNSVKNIITGKIKTIYKYYCFGEYVYVKIKNSNNYIKYNQKGNKKIVDKLPEFISNYDYKLYRWGILLNSRNSLCLDKSVCKTFEFPRCDTIKGHVINILHDNTIHSIDMRTGDFAKNELIVLPLTVKNTLKYFNPVNNKTLLTLLTIFKKNKIIKYIAYIIINMCYDL